MSHVSRALAAVAALSLIGTASPARARDVKRCGITIPRGKTGVLAKDVTCGWHCAADPAVRCTQDPVKIDDPHCPIQGDSCAPDSILLETNATLDLNGFTFTTVYGEVGVFCSAGRGRCTVKGPGTLLGGKSAPPIVPGDKDLVLEDLTIRRFYRQIETSGHLRASNVALQSCAGGLIGDRGVAAKNITLEPECSLFSGTNLVVDGIDSLGSFGAANRVEARHATVRFGTVVSGKDVVLSRSVAVPPRSDPSAASGIEIRATGKVSLRSSSVGGLESAVKPKLIDSTCQRSVKPDMVATWGVCSDD